MNCNFYAITARLLNYLARAKLETLELMLRNKTLSDINTISIEVALICSMYEEALEFYKNDITEKAVTDKLGLKAKTIISDMEFVKTRLGMS